MYYSKYCIHSTNEEVENSGDLRRKWMNMRPMQITLKRPPKGQTCPGQCRLASDRQHGWASTHLQRPLWGTCDERHWSYTKSHEHSLLARICGSSSFKKPALSNPPHTLTHQTSASKPWQVVRETEWVGMDLECWCCRKSTNAETADNILYLRVNSWSP